MRNKDSSGSFISACALVRAEYSIGDEFVNRNALYMIIGALIVVVAGFSYYAWQEEKKPDGVEIRLNEQGLSIQEN